MIIIGGGPAGLFAAHEIADDGFDILVIEKGKETKERRCKIEIHGYCVHCPQCDIMCGIGGAGTFSDGTLNLRHDIGGDLSEFTATVDEAMELVEYVDKIFLAAGAPNKTIRAPAERVENLKRRAAAVGARFLPIKQRHIGSDNAPRVIQNMQAKLLSRGVEFKVQNKVTDLIIEDGRCVGVVTDDGTYRARCVLAASGRAGTAWLNELVMRYDISARQAPIDVGMRVEVPAIIMDPITDINRDPKFHIRTEQYDDFVRTFCTNEHGFVVKESYDGFIGVNGHSLKSRRSENTNFAFLTQVELTEPLEDTTRYGTSIAKLATTIGGGKPIAQRMGDLRRGRRSTWDRLKRNPLQVTLNEVTPGDISMALPHRIVMDMIEGLEKLNEIIPGVASDSSILYAPEIKFYAMRLDVNDRMETSIENLFAAGDGAGLSRDIVNAAATGVLAGRGIFRTLETDQ